MPGKAPVSFRDPEYDTVDRQVEASIGLPKGLLSSIRTRGERSNADQVSSAGARSVYQITPATRRLVLKKYGVDAYLGHHQAAMAAGYVLKEGLDRNGARIPDAVAEYHGGTDPRNRGPVNRAYVRRVTGAMAAPAATDAGSTYDRVRRQRRADDRDQPSIQNVYDAYRSGRMSAGEASEFEQDVASGAIMLPRGGALKRQPATKSTTLPAGVVTAYNDMQSGMTIDERQQLDRDLRAGLVALPRGATLKPWRPMTGTENAKRQLGLGTRAVIEGVGDVAGIVMNPVNTLLNATGAPQALTGSPLAMANDPAINIADKIGLPKPQFDRERLLSAAERGATGGLVTFGAGSAAGTLPGVTGVVGRALASAPVVDTVSGATGGTSGEAARQSGIGPVGQVVAALAGGGAGIGAVSGAERTAGRLTRRAAELPASTPREVVLDAKGDLTEEGQELIASHGFTPDEIKRAYETPEATVPAARASEVAAPPELVRRHDGTDYPVEIVGPEQTDAAGRLHVQVKGKATGDVGFVPKDELVTIRPKPADGAVTPTPAGIDGGTAAEAIDSPTVQRIADAAEVRIPLTRGQATQDFATQDTEQTLRAQASGEGEKARTFLVDQAEKIRDATTRFREAFGPSDATRKSRGEAVKGALRELRDLGKAGISALYREAEAMGGDGIGLETAPIVDAAKRVLVEADVPDNVKNVITQEMARYGLLGKAATTAEDGLTTVKLTDGRKVQFYGEPQTLTVANAEDFRKGISAQYSADGPRKLSQAIKRSIDDAVEEAVSRAAADGGTGPVGAKLQEARRAVVEQKETFQAKDVVQKLIDWKRGTDKTELLLPENAISEIFAGETTNLEKVKRILFAKGTVQSRSAWRAIQAEGIGRIFDKAYTANTNLGGGSLGVISGAKLNSEIIRFGIPKLKVLLSPEDFARLMKLRRVVGHATIPISGTTNPSGTAFKLLRFLTPLATRFTSLPLVGPAADVVSGLVKQAKQTAEAQKTLRGMTEYTEQQAKAEAAQSIVGKATMRKRADESANAFIKTLTDVATSGRLVPAMLTTQTDGDSR